jgi:serine/threonine protein kinase
MEPEIFKSSRYDPFKTDIWSLGVTFYVIGAGCLPWDTDARSDVRVSIIQDNTAFPHNRTRGFVQPIRAMCTLDPKDMPTAAECLDFLIFHGIDLKDPRMPDYDLGGPFRPICPAGSKLPVIVQKPSLLIPTQIGDPAPAVPAMPAQ